MKFWDLKLKDSAEISTLALITYTYTSFLQSLFWWRMLAQYDKQRGPRGPVIRQIYWLRWPNLFAITLNHHWIERGFKRHFHHCWWSYHGGQFYWARESGAPWELALAAMLFIQIHYHKKNSANQNNRRWWPSCLFDLNKKWYFCGPPSIHLSYKVWLNLAK